MLSEEFLSLNPDSLYKYGKVSMRCAMGRLVYHIHCIWLPAVSVGNVSDPAACSRSSAQAHFVNSA